jgi:carboxyl-terminal processing protease
MIGTIKDYFPKTIIIGETSYWKGSVQTIKTYKDGSSLKYTIAKWFTWKTETWIDWIGITPDIEMKDDSKNSFIKNNKLDKVLEKAKSIK